MIKVLALMDSPTVSTGFAQVSKNVLRKLYDTGKYEITVVGINFNGTLTKEMFDKHPYNFVPAMPSGYQDPYGRGKVIQILTGNDRDVKPGYDILFTIQDHFILQGSDNLAGGYNFSRRIKEIQSEIIENENFDMKYLFNWIGYYPVDGNLQKRWVSDGIGMCDYPVAYTKYGADEILKFDNSDLVLKKRLSIIPHGVNFNDFYPIEEKEIKEYRKKYFPKEMPEDAFLIINVNRNQIRKDIASTIKAFSEYKKINKKAYLYLHMKQIDQGGDLWEIAKQFGLKPGEDMMLPSNFDESKGLPISELNKIYNCADVIVSSSLGEGWGFSNTESMAIKKPLITPCNTAMPEIIGMKDIYEKNVGIDYLEKNYESLRGIPIKSGFGKNDFVSMGMVDNGVIRPKVDIDDFVQKLDWVYKNKEKVEKIVDNGYKYVQSLGWENICIYWDKLFEKAYLELQNERKKGHITKKEKK